MEYTTESQNGKGLVHSDTTSTYLNSMPLKCIYLIVVWGNHY